MTRMRNVYACLVHERFDCVVDLVRNLRYFDPVSPILLYDGGTDSTLLNGSFPFERYGAIVHPSPRATQWGRLHDFALDCIRFAIEHIPFDALTIVDSDQIAIRAGYPSCIERFLTGKPKAGLLGNSASVQSRAAPVAPAVAAFNEIELWRPFLRRFAHGEEHFVRWSFWPSTVFTADAARALTALFDGDAQLRGIMARSQIWATEEIVFPTLTALLGFDVLQSPCSYGYVTYRTPYSVEHASLALQTPSAYWMHSIPRQYDDPVRTFMRERHEHYRTRGVRHTHRCTDTPIATTLPLPASIDGVEGWLEEDEARLLLGTAARSLHESPSGVVVEIGSGCGRSTIVLGHAVRMTHANAMVYAIDPHDGYVGALDRGIQSIGSTLARFDRNIARAGLTGNVETIHLRATDVHWDKSIRLLFIDRLHDYVNVASDFHHFERWIEPGGYVVFHDYADYYPGVKTFVDELIDGGTFELVDMARSLVALRRSRISAATDLPIPTTPQNGTIAPPPAVFTATEPLVSCIMPTADRAEFVPQAVTYFLRQNYANRELIIIDDGDESVAALVPDHPLIRYVRLDERRTMGAKHNLACELARGDIICHWDDDDWHADWRIRYQVDELLRHPPMTLSGLSQVLHYEPTTGIAACYRYPPNAKAWVGGNTLCYRKPFWDQHKFPDMNEGADSVFVWSLDDSCVRPLQDHTFFVAIMHARNTSPKAARGLWWHPCNADEIRSLLRDDCTFYDRWRA